jgi:hypothetical protein
MGNDLADLADLALALGHVKVAEAYSAMISELQRAAGRECRVLLHAEWDLLGDAAAWMGDLPADDDAA